MDFISKTNEHVSFRGEQIPDIVPKVNYEVSNSKQVIDKITSMPKDEQKSITLEGVHYDNQGISDVKLSTGDIVSIETAIALAENHMLKGYTTGATFRGGKTLRSLPDQSNDHVSRVHDLKQF